MPSAHGRGLDRGVCTLMRRVCPTWQRISNSSSCDVGQRGSVWVKDCRLGYRTWGGAVCQRATSPIRIPIIHRNFAWNGWLSWWWEEAVSLQGYKFNRWAQLLEAERLGGLSRGARPNCCAGRCLTRKTTRRLNELDPNDICTTQETPFTNIIDWKFAQPWSGVLLDGWWRRILGT